MLDRETHLTTIETEAGRLAAAAAEAGPDATVPTCPEWTVRDLVLHQGEVHRWATAVVSGALAKPSAIPDDFLGALPDDDGLLTWFEAGGRGLVGALRAAPDDLDAFRFLNDAPPAALFWSRRQAHETGMHRVDAESALGRCTPFDTATAADGVDEMLTGFVPRQHMRLRSSTPVTLGVRLTDAPGAWHLAISDGPTVTSRIAAADQLDAGCIVVGAASDVHLALWNRPPLSPLTVEGDASVLASFGDTVQIQWK